MGNLRKARRNHTEDQRHRMFSNLVLKGKLRKAVQFVRDRENGEVLQPYQLAEDRTGTIIETDALVLKEKNMRETIPSCATLETYEEMPIFIPVNITEEAVESVESVARKFSGSSGPGGTESEAL